MEVYHSQGWGEGEAESEKEQQQAQRWNTWRWGSDGAEKLLSKEGASMQTAHSRSAQLSTG